MKILISTSTTSTLFLWLFLVVAMSCIINLGCCSYGEINGGMNCRENERDALLKIKNALKDPSHRLASWAADADCCNWYGVMCDNTTGHVLELQLRSFSYYGEVDFEKQNKSSFGGKVSHSLLNLTHLRYLDLSNNAFDGIQIPKFLGSMESLRYLNLSYSGFGGHIPPQLGNLTSLLYLNLRSYYTRSSSEDLHWLSGLSSLQFLDMTLVDLSKSLNWMNVLNTLPSLQELYLLNCNLPSPHLIRNLNISSLSVLDLSDNGVSESIVSWISHFKHLKSLYLAYSFSYGSTIPREFINMSTTLRELDLSYNGFNSSIPIWLYDFSNLEYLNLAYSGIQGQISDAIQNMTSLVTLDLSYNDQLFGGIPASFRNLCNLRILSLQFVNLSQQVSQFFENLLGCGSNGLESLDLYNCQLFGNWVSKDLGQFKNLAFLDLSSNAIYGPFPTSLVELKSLTFLRLSYNSISGSIPISLGELKFLTSLDLSRNSISGSIPISLGELKFLTSLDLSQNSIRGSIPMSLGELKSLISLDLSENSISGSIPMSLGELKALTNLDLSENSISGSIPIFLGELKSLRFLSLSNNKLSGDLPTNLENLKKLEELIIEGNSISGPVPTFIGHLKTLRVIYFSSNKLNGTLPESFGRLSNLEEACISDNSMEGDVSEIHFANLSRLVAFYANGNKLNLKVRSWLPPPGLEILELRSWNVGPQFSTWLPSLKNLIKLDLSNCGISTSSIPGWFRNWSSQLYNLNLSHNNIQGMLPNKLTFPPITDLSSNNFQSPLPHNDKTFLSKLDLSNNSFSGSLSNFLCRSTNASWTYLLNLENNILDGEIPNCWNRWGNLEVLRLSNNKFNGSIPESIGSLMKLELLHLHSNNLSSEIPFSLRDCTRLVTLDIGGNKLEGNIPSWIGEKLLSLIILDLGRNSFSGKIPKKICHVTSLHILDFSNNNLFGTIPRCLSNFSAMININESIGVVSVQNSSHGFDTMRIRMKGAMYEYSSILGFVKSVDLSSNRLSGEIPEEITCLKGLQSLNLSHNSLSGRIPKNIGSTTSLESLDLCCNQFIGEIPQSISNLTFLGHLNLSYNKLSGRIPLGTQIQGFDSSCFIGNELCGKPLTDNCSGSVSPPSSKENGNSHEFQIEWLYTVALGFIVGFWGVVGPLLLNRNWRLTYFRFLRRVVDKIYIWWHLM